MPTVSTTVTIPHPPSAVWAVLTDWPRYPEWNPFIIKLSGPQTVGAAPTVTILPPSNTANTKGAGMTFSPTILTLERDRHLHWRGRLWGLPGLFTGHHHFVLHPTEEGGTRFEHYEVFGGVIAWVLKWVGDVYADTGRGFGGMNEALRGRVEELGRGRGEGE